MKTIANLLFLSFSIVSLSSATELEELGKVEFTGNIKQPEDISAVAVFGDGEYLVIGTDEGVQIQVLKQSGDDKYKVE